MPIHVLALRVTAIVANDNTIRIDNRGDPELKHLTHLMADDFTRDKEINEAMHDERSVGLTAMLSANDNDDRLGLSFTLASVSDLEKRDVYIAV